MFNSLINIPNLFNSFFPSIWIVLTIASIFIFSIILISLTIGAIILFSKPRNRKVTKLGSGAISLAIGRGAHDALGKIKKVYLLYDKSSSSDSNSSENSKKAKSPLPFFKFYSLNIGSTLSLFPLFNISSLEPANLTDFQLLVFYLLLSFLMGLWLYIDIIGTLITLYLIKYTNIEEKYPKYKKFINYFNRTNLIFLGFEIFLFLAFYLYLIFICIKFLF